MCGSMADIQPAAAEIRRGKKKHRAKYNGLPYYIGRPQLRKKGRERISEEAYNVNKQTM